MRESVDLMRSERELLVYENESLQEQIGELSTRTEDLSSRLSVAESQFGQERTKAIQLEHRIIDLQYALARKSGSEAITLTPAEVDDLIEKQRDPKNVFDAVDIADGLFRTYGRRVVFTERAWETAMDSPFLRPRDVLAALLRLGFLWHEQVLAADENSARASCCVVVGFYQSQTAMTKHGEERKATTPDGEDVYLQKHLKLGGGPQNDQRHLASISAIERTKFSSASSGVIRPAQVRSKETFVKFEPAQRRLRDLVQDFNDGAILLPQFQRDYVWKPMKIRNLLDSLLRGFPIGGFYLWKPSGRSIDAKQKALGPIKFASEAQSYLIDGQQRLTSLEAAFGLYSGEDKGGEELVCYLDLASVDIERAKATRLFVSYGGNQAVKRRVDDGDPTLIPVSGFLSGRNPDLRDETKQQLESLRWARDRIEKALRRVDNAFDMLDQIVPCTIISDVSDQEAVEIFSRLNKGGSPLSQGDVKAAELARGPAVEVLKRMRVFVTEERPSVLVLDFRLLFGRSFCSIKDRRASSR